MTDREIILGIINIFNFVYYGYRGEYLVIKNHIDIINKNFSSDSIIDRISLTDYGFILYGDRTHTHTPIVLYNKPYYDKEIISIDYEGDIAINYPMLLENMNLLEDAKKMDDIQFKLSYGSEIKFRLISDSILLKTLVEKILEHCTNDIL